MHLYDPSRPRLAGLPRLLGTCRVIPRLEIRPNADGSVTVATFVPAEDDRFASAWREARIGDYASLGEFLDRWKADPEATLMQVFGWNGREATERPQSAPKPPKPRSRHPFESLSVSELDELDALDFEEDT